jgi:predicted transcriptional regulator
MRIRQPRTAASAARQDRSATTSRNVQINERQRDRAIHLRAKGLSEEEVARKLSLSQDAVSEIWRKYREDLSRCRSERKRVRLSDDEDEDGEKEEAAKEARKLQKVIHARPPTPPTCMSKEEDGGLLEESDDDLDVSPTRSMCGSDMVTYNRSGPSVLHPLLQEDPRPKRIRQKHPLSLVICARRQSTSMTLAGHISPHHVRRPPASLGNQRNRYVKPRDS